MKKQVRKRPLRALLAEIDQTVEEHKRRYYQDSNVHLQALLDELNTYHPLPFWTKQHGQKLVDELFDGRRVYDFRSSFLESEMRSAFQLSEEGSKVGAVKRDFRRITESFAAPFALIGEKIGITYVIIQEMWNHRKQSSTRQKGGHRNG